MTDFYCYIERTSRIELSIPAKSRAEADKIKNKIIKNGFKNGVWDFDEVV